MRFLVRALAILVGLVVFAICVALVWSYRASNMDDVFAYLPKIYADEPACSVPRVDAALELALQKGNNSNRLIALAADRAYLYARDPGPYPHHVYAYRRFQQDLWLRLMASRVELVRAFCATEMGKDYSFPKIGGFVGLHDLAHARPEELQALADVYVLDLRTRWPREKIVTLYQKRLQEEARSR